ncbi:MAG: tetratricopeptide repeat protein, partial [Bacteroidetes bacterium]|nr:tetratricopeptide repeat protein [Bacteroidota bacterium]
MKAQNKNIDSLQNLIEKDKSDTNKVIHLYLLTREYELTGDFEKGLNYGAKALELAHKLDFKKGIAYASCAQGNIYLRKAEYPKSLDYYLKALKLDEEQKNKKGIAARLVNIGIVYAVQCDYPKALHYYFRALKIDEELGNKEDLAMDYGNIGIVYWSQGDYPRALDYYFKALKIDEETGDKNGIARHFGNIGLVYATQGNYPQALDYYFKALKMREELGAKNLVATTLCNIGSLYTAIGKYKEAEQYLKNANTIDAMIGELDGLRESEEALSRLYDTTSRYELALIHYKKAMAIRDTLFSQENKKQLVRKEMNYEFDKKEAATKAENDKQKAIAEEKNRKQKIITWSVAFGLLFVLLFSGFIFRSLRITRKQKQIIEIKSIETEQQKKIIEEKNKDITDSIHYAKRIQHALLRDEEHTSMHLPEHFILFMPKDIVSGDFYWGAEKNEYWYFAAVDCTGHGVPGAVMSMIGVSFLNDIVSIEGLPTPAEILNRLRDKIIKELRQTSGADGNKDGMDISLARLNLKTNELDWAGANNSLNFIRNGQLEIVKADKQPIGYHPNSYPFTN